MTTKEVKISDEKKDALQELVIPTEGLDIVLPTASGILEKAAKHIRDREVVYDRANGEKSMDRAVRAFNALHGTFLTTAQGWHFMQLVKNSRFFSQDTYHADSGEDGAAYGALMAEARAKEV